MRAQGGGDARSPATVNVSTNPIGPTTPPSASRRVTALRLTVSSRGSALMAWLSRVHGYPPAGYSPIHQRISDLGVGANGWLVDAALVLNGLLMFALVSPSFAVHVPS
jgi:Protein of unknown function (DUF998)